jgi:C1A family cysteine protease
MTNRTYGWIRPTTDERDFRFAAPTSYGGAFVDLTAGFPQEPYDQLALGSCVSQATVAAVDFARVKQGLTPLDPGSRLFVYYEGRRLSGQPLDQDTGLQIRDGFTAIAKSGVPAEADWPYDVDRFADKPPAKAYADAGLDEAVAYGQIDQGAIDATVASGYPVVFGAELHESFESDAVAETGVVPVPAPGEKVVGGHAQVIVSTVRDGSLIPGGVPGRKYRRVRNSWSPSWGLGGYSWMPIEILDDPDTSADFWVVTAMSDPNRPTPTPPAPTPDADATFADALHVWLGHKWACSGSGVARAAARAWLAARGL